MRLILFRLFSDPAFKLWFILLSGICANNESAFAQEKIPVTFGKVAIADFNLPHSKAIDSNTSAVIVADLGNTSFVGNKIGWVSYVYKRHTRIKIIDKKAFDAATIKVLLYKDDENREELSDVTATSFNIENGQVAEARLDKKDIFEDKIDKNRIEKKFTIPAVKEGSIIEYAYTVTSVYFQYLPGWEFQSINYPCLWSEYDVNIPNLVGYVFLKQGVHPFFIDQAGDGYQSYSIREKADPANLGQSDRNLTVDASIVKHRWVMKDVPAFKVENYISTPYNYIDEIEFQLSQTYDGETVYPSKNTWKKATEELLNEEDFGRPLKSDYSDFSKEVGKIIEGENDDLGKAKKIYYYIQDNVKCTNHYNKYIKTSLRDVLKKRDGDVGEVNLLLASMLRQAEIHADPVLLSTRDFRYNSSTYPIMQRLNYVVCRALINGRAFFLDASQPMLGFGRLAEDCYNGHARIICDKDSGSVYFLADSIKESKFTSVIITNDEKSNGMMSGSFQSQPGYYESEDIREKISDKGEKEYYKSIELLYGSDIKIEGIGIDSLRQFELPVKLHYDFSFENNTEDGIIYFNPMVAEAYKDNPFKAAERKYPVEMPYPLDETYIFNMEIPAGYMVDEIPKSVKVAYNDTEGYFEYIIQKDDANVQLRSRLKLNKAFFSAEDYNSLREFFAYVVKKQSEQIVFKKKK